MSSANPPAGELAKKITLLEGWTKSSIDYVNGARKTNRSKATGIKVGMLCLSGLATILLGLNIAAGVDLQFKNVAFALTSIVTVLNALEPFFNYRALWVEHERAKARFNRLYDQIRFYKEGKAETDLKAEAVNELFSEYDKIWSELNDAWSRERRQLEEATAAAAARKTE
jgi:hypothetical protein